MYIAALCQSCANGDNFQWESAAIDGDNEIRVTSMNDRNGVVTVDSLTEWPWTVSFDQGTEAIVRIHEHPLRVIKNPLRS